MIPRPLRFPTLLLNSSSCPNFMYPIGENVVINSPCIKPNDLASQEAKNEIKIKIKSTDYEANVFNTH